MSDFDSGNPEKLLRVEDVSDVLAEDAGQVPVYDWQSEELDRRRARIGGRIFSWEEVQSIVRARNGGSPG